MSSIHQTFTQVYSTASISPSYVESLTGFSEASPNYIFPFQYRTSCFCYLAIFPALQLSKNSLKFRYYFNKLREPFLYIFRFRRKFPLLGTAYFFPHWNVLSKVHKFSIVPDNPPSTKLGLQQCYLWRIYSLMITSFFPIGTSKQHPFLPT